MKASGRQSFFTGALDTLDPADRLNLSTQEPVADAQPGKDVSVPRFVDFDVHEAHVAIMVDSWLASHCFFAE